MSDLAAKVIIFLWGLGLIGILLFVIYGLYLRKHILPQVEVMFRGHDLMSKQLYFSLLACIQYGGAFTSYFLAKRSKMLEARESVPVDMQLKFKVSFWLFMISGLILVGVVVFIQYSK